MINCFDGVLATDLTDHIPCFFDWGTGRKSRDKVSPRSFFVVLYGESSFSSTNPELVEVVHSWVCFEFIECLVTGFDGLFAFIIKPGFINAFVTGL